MNPYICEQCGWEYVWTMGDRVKAVKRHQLLHLVETKNKPEQPDMTLVRDTIDYIYQRPQTAQWL